MITLAAVLIALLALAFTLVIREKDLPPAAPASPLAHLEERRKIIHENLRDLQFEFRVGKMLEADYQEAKRNLQQELAQVVAAMGGETAGAPAAERERAAAEPRPARLSAGVQGGEGETRDAGTVCPHCGAKFAQPLKFCGECGRRMAGGEA